MSLEDKLDFRIWSQNKIDKVNLEVINIRFHVFQKKLKGVFLNMGADPQASLAEAS